MQVALCNTVQSGSSLKDQSRREQTAGNNVIPPPAIVSLKLLHSSIYTVYTLCIRHLMSSSTVPLVSLLAITDIMRDSFDPAVSLG